MSAAAPLPLITSCYRPDGRDVKLDLSIEEIGRAVQDESALVWVDIAAGDGGRAEGERVLRDIFGFHPLTIDDCYNTLLDPPKVDDYGSYLFIILHEVHYDDDELSTSELNLYAGRNYVVSLHKQPSTAVAEVRRRAEQRSVVLDKGADFLAHALIDVLVDDFQPVVERLGDELEAVEERVLASPERETLARVLRLRRITQRVKRSILPQRDVANRFARGEYAQLIRPESLMYFRDIYDHTARVEDMIDSLRDLADNTLNTYLSSVNNRVNEVMKTLAIVTVVFLPLTLIASIYGTNFDETLPEYSLEAGFIGMLVAMVLVAFGLIMWFRWRRWI